MPKDTTRIRPQAGGACKDDKGNAELDGPLLLVWLNEPERKSTMTAPVVSRISTSADYERTGRVMHVSFLYRLSFAAALLLCFCYSPGCSGCRSEPEQQTAGTEQEAASETRRPDPEADRFGAQPTANRPDPNRTNAAEVAGSDAAPDSLPAETGSIESPRQPHSTTGVKSPDEAVERARDLSAQSRRKASDGDHTGAFQDARTAWSLVRQFPDDQTCREMERRILSDLEALEERADLSRGDPPASTKPLILQ